MSDMKRLILFSIKIQGFIMVLIFSLPFGLCGQSKPDTLSFIHITDPHVCNLTGYHPFFIKSRQHYGQNKAPLENFFKTIPGKFKSDMVIITGDNIDYYEAETAKGDMLDTQIEQYTRSLEVSEVPVYLTLGNHDIASYWVDSDSTYASDQFRSGFARSAWIRNVSCFRDGTYYSRIFKVDTTVYRFIFLDNSYYLPQKTKNDQLPFVIDQSQMFWLENELKQSATDVEIVFMHMPLPKSKTNIQGVIKEPIDQKSSGTDPLDFLSALERNSSVRMIFTGHEHKNIISTHRFPGDYKITQVMTAVFGADPNSWRRIQLTADKVIISLPGHAETEYVVNLR
jgi:3',5'-cyclic AMP phosphodiesterase CpdA